MERLFKANAVGNLFYTELSGPGMIYLQSMSIDKLRRLFPPSVSSSGDGDGGDDGGD